MYMHYLAKFIILFIYSYRDGFQTAFVFLRVYLVN